MILDRAVALLNAHVGNSQKSLAAERRVERPGNEGTEAHKGHDIYIYMNTIQHNTMKDLNRTDTNAQE